MSVADNQAFEVEDPIEVFVPTPKLTNSELLAKLAAEVADDDPAFLAAVEKARVAEEQKIARVKAQRHARAMMSASDVQDMSANVLQGRLGDLCETMTDGKACAKHPRGYAWVALTTAAGTQYPKVKIIQQGSHIKAPNQQTNLFAALIGEKGTGKSQSIDISKTLVGVPNTQYSDIRAGSIEGLVKQLQAQQVAPQMIIDLDEWEHLLKKAGIEGSTFYTSLNTMFYKDELRLVIAGGKPIFIQSELSIIGGIVESAYSELLGVGSHDGFHDRLYQARCPSSFVFNYRDPEISKAVLDFVPVKIDGSVWEVKADWSKEFAGLGREAEIAIRVARICASADGRATLYGKDLGPARELVIEQRKIRQALQPNAGLTNDAKMAFEIMKALPQDGTWVPSSWLYKKTHADKYGPGVFGWTLKNLQQTRQVALFEPNKKTTEEDLKILGLDWAWKGGAGRLPTFVARGIDG